MTQILVYMVWISSLFYPEKVKELQEEHQCSRLGNFQKVTKEDAQKWFVEKLGGNLI